MAAGPQLRNPRLGARPGGPAVRMIGAHLPQWGDRLKPQPIDPCRSRRPPSPKFGRLTRREWTESLVRAAQLSAECQNSISWKPFPEGRNDLLLQKIDQRHGGNHR